MLHVVVLVDLNVVFSSKANFCADLLEKPDHFVKEYIRNEHGEHVFCKWS